MVFYSRVQAESQFWQSSPWGFWNDLHDEIRLSESMYTFILIKFACWFYWFNLLLLLIIFRFWFFSPSPSVVIPIPMSHHSEASKKQNTRILSKIREAVWCSQEEAIIANISLCLSVQWPFGTGRKRFSFTVGQHIIQPGCTHAKAFRHQALFATDGKHTKNHR